MLITAWAGSADCFAINCNCKAVAMLHKLEQQRGRELSAVILMDSVDVFIQISRHAIAWHAKAMLLAKARAILQYVHVFECFVEFSRPQVHT